MLDPDEQSWAIDDHFPILNEEQMSNKVGVEHQPDMMLWSINPSLFIPDHQHNSADFLYNSSSRWSFQIFFVVCLYQIATLEKMLTCSNHRQDVTLRYYHHSHGKINPCWWQNPSIFPHTCHHFVDFTWQNHTKTQVFRMATSRLRSRLAHCWVNKKTPRAFHWLCICRASHGAYMECMYTCK